MSILIAFLGVVVILFFALGWKLWYDNHEKSEKVSVDSSFDGEVSPSTKKLPAATTFFSGLFSVIIVIIFLEIVALVTIWAINAWFPKEVRFLSYVPQWNYETNSGHICKEVSEGTYVLQCRGKLNDRTTANASYVVNCVRGNPPKWVSVSQELLTEMPIPDIRHYGMVVGSLNGKYILPGERFTVESGKAQLCVTVNVPQRHAGFSDLIGSIQIHLEQARIPLPILW